MKISYFVEPLSPSVERGRVSVISSLAQQITEAEHTTTNCGTSLVARNMIFVRLMPEAASRKKAKLYNQASTHLYLTRLTRHASQTRLCGRTPALPREY